jgi:hypothetical protein
MAIGAFLSSFFFISSIANWSISWFIVLVDEHASYRVLILPSSWLEVMNSQVFRVRAA